MANSAGFASGFAPVLASIRNASTVRDYRAIGKQVVHDAGRALAQRASVKDELESSYTASRDYFWTCPTACSVYSVIALAVLFRRAWILHCISLIVLDRILLIGTRWIVYAIDDDELWYCIRYLRGWLQLFLREGEQILSGPGAQKFAMAYSVLWTAPKGVSYIRHIVRYKMIALDKTFLSELGANRYGKRKANLWYALRANDPHHIKSTSKEGVKSSIIARAITGKQTKG
jgi:hypothetical protein